MLHLGQDWFMYSGAHHAVQTKLDMNTTLVEEFRFAKERMMESESQITFCHNDPHSGNILVDDGTDGKLDPSTIQFIDYDNSAWGYRAFDIDYWFAHFRTWPEYGLPIDVQNVGYYVLKDRTIPQQVRLPPPL